MTIVHQPEIRDGCEKVLLPSHSSLIYPIHQGIQVRRKNVFSADMAHLIHAHCVESGSNTKDSRLVRDGM